MLKKIFLLFIIILVLYIIGLFTFSEKIKTFGENIGLKKFNDIVFEIKEKLDSIGNIDVDKTIKNIQSGATEALDSATNVAKEIKGKVDSLRSTAKDVEETYNSVKTQIDETTKNIKEIGEKINEAKTTVENVTNIFN